MSKTLLAGSFGQRLLVILRRYRFFMWREMDVVY